MQFKEEKKRFFLGGEQKQTILWTNFKTIMELPSGGTLET
jgi:hypothetical protein